MIRRMKISKGGQLSIPSEIRRRWGGRNVVLRDEGDRIVVTPAASDAVDAAAGVFREYARELDLEAIRGREREAEAEAGDRRTDSLGSS